MKRDEVLNALRAGGFDGISHSYETYKGYGTNSHQLEMSVSGGSIESQKFQKGNSLMGRKMSDGKIEPPKY